MTGKQPAIPAAYIALRESRVYTEAATAARKAELAAMLDSFKPALAAAFDAVNGRASSFTLGAADAVTLAIETESRLESLGVPKASRTGATVTCTSGGPSAKAYKYRAIGTRFTLRRSGKGDWTLTSVERVELHAKQSGRLALRVSSSARDAILRRAMDGITLLEGEAVA